ncbi:MAG: hypothetical protein INR65_05895, partial [Gluconacetobacter diazotrophicus]|nr:hypothetical protein [Gluconacetobacter diazotrophicus]
MDGFSSVSDDTLLAAAIRDGRSPAPAVPRGLRTDAGIGKRSRLRAAGQDVRDGLALWRLAVSLGWLDIRLRYRGSALGPLWLTLSSAVMVAAMGAVYSLLFHQAPHSYLPFLAVSLILWQAGIGTLSGDACTCFTNAEGTIRAMRMPFTVQVVRTVVSNTVVLGHNLVVPLAVFA